MSKLTALRVLHASQLLVSTVLWAAYTGILVSLLSVPNNPYKILDDILAVNLRIATMKSPIAKAYLKVKAKGRSPHPDGAVAVTVTAFCIAGLNPRVRTDALPTQCP